MTRFQQAGVLVAIIPMGIAQSIRLEHDRSYFRYFRENKTWQVATAFYYLMLLVISVVAVMGGVRLMDMSLVAFIVMMMFPFFIIFVYGDIKACGQVEKE